MSGLFTASFALGNFCGPTLSGIIYDQAGFSYNCLVLQFLVAVVLVLNVICYFVPEGEPEYEAIPDTPTTVISGLDRRDSVFPELPADVIRSVHTGCPRKEALCSNKAYNTILFLENAFT